MFEAKDILSLICISEAKIQFIHTVFNEDKTMIDFFINHKDILIVKEFIPIIQMLINWREYIINSFNIVDGRRISNRPIEGFNSNFKKMMNVANGLYNFARFRNRLMYCYNKPNCLSPVKEVIKKRLRGKRGPYKKPGN